MTDIGQWLLSGLDRSVFSFKCDSHSAHARCGFLGMLGFVPDVWEDSNMVLLMQVPT